MPKAEDPPPSNPALDPALNPKQNPKQNPQLDSTAVLAPGALVLYRSEAAVVREVEKKQLKLHIQTESGKKASVRPKDVWLLSHGFGSASLSEVTKRLERTELEEGWGLLRELGQTCTLKDLAEAVFSGCGPCELYNAFCLINQTPYFKGRPDAILVRSSEDVALELERKRHKEEQERRWQQFYQHTQTGDYSDADVPFIEEIEAIAYGEKPTCRLFRELKREGSPESAHDWLLAEKLWNERFNPYLRRSQVSRQPPKLEHLSSEEEQNLWRSLLRDYCELLAQNGLQNGAKGFASRANSASFGQQPVSAQLLKNLEDLLSRFGEKQIPLYPSAETQGEERPNGEGGAAFEGRWNCAARRDLTGLCAWAIDDPWSKDPDDAVSLEDASTIWVHIADPASLLPFGSKLAQEAMNRGATVYVPEGSYAMLPKEWIELLGLGLQRVSMALSVKLRIAAPQKAESGLELPATVEVLDLCRSWVQVRPLSYEKADQILCSAQPHPLQTLWQLCRSHEELRKSNGAVQFSMYNTRVVAAQKIQVEPLPDTPSRNLVAEAMLMSGAAMARFAHQNGLALPFLCQPPPREALPPLNSMANMFAARKALSPSSVHCEAQSHSGIGVPMYARSTSPLRRYFDLLAHQQIHAFLLQNEDRALRPLNRDELLYCIAQAEQQVSRVNSAQRLSQQHWQMLYLLQQPKQRLYKAVVLEIRERHGGRQNSGCKALCSLSEVGIEVLVFSKVPLELNQELDLQLKGVRLSLREAHFQMAQSAP